MSSSSTYFYHVIIHQVLSFTPAACLCNTSWAAFWLRYSSSHYDGDYTYTIIYTYIYQHNYTYICSTFLSPSEDFKKAAIHRRNTFYGRFIGGALTFLLGTGTYIQDLVSAIASLGFNYNFSELWVWTDCSSTSWFGCWQFGTHPWIRHGLVDFIIIAHCSMNNGHGHADAIWASQFFCNLPFFQFDTSICLF